jgi:hypothetical protein
MAEKGTPLDVLPVKLITQVLRFCDWQTRAAVMQLNRSFVENFAPGNSAFWRAMCCWLSVEDAVYVPRISHSRDWRTTFVVYYPARSLWKGPPVQESAQFSISVVARFKPKASDGELKVAAAHVPKVVLPLHQRLQMLMARYKCSASDARRMMWAKDRRASSVSAGSNAEMEKENINGQQLSLPTDLDGQPAYVAFRKALLQIALPIQHAASLSGSRLGPIALRCAFRRGPVPPSLGRRSCRRGVAVFLQS